MCANCAAHYSTTPPISDSSFAGITVSIKQLKFPFNLETLISVSRDLVLKERGLDKNSGIAKKIGNPSVRKCYFFVQENFYPALAVPKSEEL